MTMKKLYIFDFDGTLVNTFYDSVIAYNKALKKHGYKEYEYESLDKIDYEDFSSNMTDNWDVLESYGQIYMQDEKKHMKAYPNIKETLIHLSNNYKTLAICSNREQCQLMEYTKKIFPEINFKYIIGYQPDMPYKPDKRMINRIIENENYTNDEIVYVGDKEVDIQTAINADIDVIIVRWGQGNKQAYSSSYPIKVIDDAREILTI